MPPLVFGFGADGDRTIMLAVAPFSLASDIVTATSNSTKKTPSAPANLRRILGSLSPTSTRAPTHLSSFLAVATPTAISHTVVVTNSSSSHSLPLFHYL